MSQNPTLDRPDPVRRRLLQAAALTMTGAAALRPAPAKAAPPAAPPAAPTAPSPATPAPSSSASSPPSTSSSSSSSTTSGETVLEGHWRDPSRARDLPWRLRLPEGDGAVALVVFSHGLGGGVEAGTRWARAWADAGIATLHLQHPGSDRALRAGGPDSLRRAATPEQLAERAADVHLALDELLRAHQAGQGPWARVRADALGMAGHSFGAQTALAVAGRDFRAPGAADLTESRFKAFAAFSPAAGHAAGGLKGVTRPMLCLTGSRDANPIGPEPDGRHRRAVYDTLPAGAKAQLWVHGADHATLSGGPARRDAARPHDTPAASGASPDDHVSALIASISTDWWLARLMDDEGATERLRRPRGLRPADEWMQG